MKEKICIPMLVGILANSNLNQVAIDALLNNNEDPNKEHQPKCIKENCSLWIPESFAGSLHGEEHCGLINK